MPNRVKKNSEASINHNNMTKDWSVTELDRCVSIFLKRMDC